MAMHFTLSPVCVHAFQFDTISEIDKVNNSLRIEIENRRQQYKWRTRCSQHWRGLFTAITKKLTIRLL